MKDKCFDKLSVFKKTKESFEEFEKLKRVQDKGVHHLRSTKVSISKARQLHVLPVNIRLS